MWEYKFVFKDDRVAEAMFETIAKMESFAGYRCTLKESVVNNDYYFDTHDLDLEARGMVCRIRRQPGKGHCDICIKKQTLAQNGEVIYLQTHPVRLGNKGFKDAMSGKLPGSFDEIFHIAEVGKIEYIMGLKVYRSTIALTAPSSSEVIAFLNLDRIEAMLPGSREAKAVSYEIELKSSRQLFPEAEMLRNYLRNAFNLIPIARSKLRRLAPLIRTIRKGTVQKVFLDMDTGVDDALALMFAMNSAELEVTGITTVSGNVDAAQSARNTAAVLNSIREKISKRYPNLPPVASGRPPETDLPDASDVHGIDGLGGVCEKYLDESIEIRDDALRLFKSIVDGNEPATVTLITTGPLTNLAHWIDNIPETVKRLRTIVCMGGVFFQSGNRSQVAEFNIHSAPEAACRVVEFCRKPISTGRYEWRETLPLTFVGLDVTHEVRFQRITLDEAMKTRPDDKYLTFVKEITGYYMDFYHRNEGLNGCYLHDPLAVGYVMDPSLCQAEQYHVEIEYQGRFTSGMSVADYRPTRLFKDKMKEVTWICYKVDTARFENLFHERVLGLSGQNRIDLITQAGSEKHVLAGEF